MVRTSQDHVPGTLYPGVRSYADFFRDDPFPDDHPDKHLLGPVEIVLVSIVCAPFAVADLVLTPTYDTLVFPYDLTRHFMNREEASN